MTTDPDSETEGAGRVVLRLLGLDAVFSELSYKYPLKLLSPRITRRHVAIAYILAYGGGLVGGDSINLDVDVGSGTILLLLTQGSTKVFKRRAVSRVSRVSPFQDDADGVVTSQKMLVSVATDGLLLLLPDPVTCFSSASYNQTQIFHLESNASVVLLDWITAGRISRGEEWEFSRYRSINEVWVGGMRIVRDALLLEDQPHDSEHVQVLPRSLKNRMEPYFCYATLILYGRSVQGITISLELKYQTISIYQQSHPADLLWSLSHVHDGCVVVRLAGKDTESVKTWLKDELSGLQELVGIDIYNKAFL